MKMAAAVAKAPEKKSPWKSTGTVWLFLSYWHRNSPHLTFLSGLFAVFPMCGLRDTGNTSWEKMKVCENHHKQKTKPKYRTISKFPKLFQTNMLGIVEGQGTP